MRFFGNLFRRKRALDPQQWQAGDIAECINTRGWWLNGVLSAHGPGYGETYRVQAVEEPSNTFLGPTTCLLFSAFPGRFMASGFRKVQPRADALEAGTATSIEDLRPAPYPRETEDA